MLAARLCPDPLGELMHSPRHCSRSGVFLKRKERERRGGRRWEGRPYLIDL